MSLRLIQLTTVLLLALGLWWQAQLWFGKNGFTDQRALEAQIPALESRMAEIEAENERLKIEIRELKSGYETIESLARSELGMIKSDETFYLLPDTGSDELTTRPDND